MPLIDTICDNGKRAFYFTGFAPAFSCAFKQNEQQALMEENKQTISMLIIDKKRMKMKEAGLPQIVIDQTPKLIFSGGVVV